VAELSPAHKIVAAFNDRHELCGPFDDDWVEQCMAAALRAAADQVVPPDPCGNDCCITQCEQLRSELLTLATELEANR
jgi:hypothetical protein